MRNTILSPLKSRRCKAMSDRYTRKAMLPRQCVCVGSSRLASRNLAVTCGYPREPSDRRRMAVLLIGECCTITEMTQGSRLTHLTCHLSKTFKRKGCQRKVSQKLTESSLQTLQRKCWVLGSKSWFFCGYYLLQMQLDIRSTIMKSKDRIS